ncbi:peptide chain release factor N(5)-glutamine methyltransferase [Patescibacteria group bacterium]|nr:peptide chain release factor N(5)-glutamine methyltransferase [Patescibacteria group bacterium]MBU1501044.1 peptide chain release factor N(5)-glutamine methyltransferase [Patescibacteria group bacterium]MBU2081083.1 peptide chain release factor N(5)-glutamine methyltransferase [Patescibacteria group bacterium]MBU2124175.1 peptide chain release factor N(5)-glutamine methyltransferase [Patescibacteria group bacterium]MBU2195031.1 peptide chain release factor N(5)-glutamine methyltransferase [P
MNPERALEIGQLLRDKYGGDPEANITEDIARLDAGEPLAYIIGWVPFLGLTIRVDSHPLIPRPETEWWAEELIAHLKEKFGAHPFTLLDLCAGSGAIGLSVLKHLSESKVSFGEIVPEHAILIKRNLEENDIDPARADIRIGDLFAPFEGEVFSFIVSNPPYVPSGRTLEKSVTFYEPASALYAGTDGLEIIQRIAEKIPAHLQKPSEVWIEADIANVAQTGILLKEGGASQLELRNDQYGRPRLVVGYYE